MVEQKVDLILKHWLLKTNLAYEQMQEWSCMLIGRNEEFRCMWYGVSSLADKQVSLSMQGNRKLSLRFYGPYEDSSPIAYKLELTSAKVENSFCFSCFDVFEKKRLAWLSI